MNTQFVYELFKEYQDRKSRNSAYSERAFARSVGLSPGFLKLLFQKKKKISEKRAVEVARRLSWSEARILSFTSAAEVKGAKFQKIAEAEFFEISDWYNFAIIELLKTSKKPMEAKQIAERLDLSSDEVNYSLARLEKLKFIWLKNGRARALVDSYEVPAISSEGIRKYHRQTLNKALEAIDLQEFARRDFKGLCLAFDPDRMQEAEDFFADFIREFEAKFSTGKKTAVYQLNLAFHQLDKGGTK